LRQFEEDRKAREEEIRQSRQARAAEEAAKRPVIEAADQKTKKKKDRDRSYDGPYPQPPPGPFPEQWPRQIAPTNSVDISNQLDRLLDPGSR
jgi:hypothetical protein